MKIHLKRIYFIVIFHVLLGGTLIAETSFLPDVFLSVASGLTSGNAYEIVYRGNEILSELEWPMQPVYFIEIGTSLVWKAGLEISAHVSNGIPGKVGIFKDSDYDNQPFSPEKTRYSQHNAYLEHALDFNSSASWNFTIKKIDIAPSLGFRYLLTKWTGQDGYYLDTSEPGISIEDAPKKEMFRTQISYQIEYIIPTVGVSISIPFSEKLHTSFSVVGSPFVTCTGTDNHFERKKLFIDEMKRGVLVEPSLKIKWNGTKQYTFFLEGYWTHITNLRGDTLTQTDSSPIYIQTLASNGSGSGASLEAISFKIGLIIQLSKDHCF